MLFAVRVFALLMVSSLLEGFAGLFNGGWAGLALAATIPLALMGRWFYIKRIRPRQLFFEPWTNHSGDPSLDVGASLSELLYFELQSLHRLLRVARENEGLWNERSFLPVLERMSDGEPSFLRDVELLGLPGRLTKLVQFVAQPQRMRGSIHEFGNEVSLQVLLEGVEPKSRLGWSRTISKEDLKKIPDEVRLIAHEIVIDLGHVAAFKSPGGFLEFTRGLREHIRFKELNGRPECREAAKGFYQNAIDAEGASPIASYALGELLYSEYKEVQNDQAIDRYFEALRSDTPELRAKAFRGLADAFCQKVHRHQKGGPESLQDAMRWASFALEECLVVERVTTRASWLRRFSARGNGDPGRRLPARDEASIRKALAFATQMTAVKLAEEQEGESDADASQYDESRISEAMETYRLALELDAAFVTAHNNLGYLYLERAKRAVKCDDRGAARDDLSRAQKSCRDALETDRTFAFAYDNLGSTWFEMACLELTEPEPDSRLVIEALQEAENNFRKAVAFKPDYSAAHNDRARLHLKRAEWAAHEPLCAPLGPRSELRRALEAHRDCLLTLGGTDASPTVHALRCDEQFWSWLGAIYTKEWVQDILSNDRALANAGCRCIQKMENAPQSGPSGVPS